MSITVSPLFGDDPPDPPNSSVVSSDNGTPSRQLGAKIPSDEEVTNLASEARNFSSQIGDKLLASHKAADLGEMSAKLAQLVGVAKGYNPAQVKHGLVDRALSAFRSERDRLLAHMQSVKQQVDQVTAELDRMSATARERIGDLATLRQENYKVHEIYKDAVAKANDWLAAVQAALATPPAVTDSFATSSITTLQSKSRRLQVETDDFATGMTLCKQRDIELQMTTDNAQAILDEFTRAQTLVIPALKGLLEKQLIAMEQATAVATDKMLHDTLDEALRLGAAQTADNAVKIATAQQTAAVNLNTIEECETLLETAQTKVREIEEQGRQQRIENAAKRAEIEKRMLASVAR